MTGVRWLPACLLLVAAVVGHDVLMASSGQHVPGIVAESTCEPAGPAAHHAHKAHAHHEPATSVVDDVSVAPSIDCDEVRVVTPSKRALETGASPVVAILPTMPPALDLAVASIPIEPDWLARDPHARRALWQVYRI